MFPITHSLSPRHLAALLVACIWLMADAAQAQMPGGPPAVGVVRVARQAVTESSEFVGRIQSVDRVALTARVTAFLEQRLFVEGTEVREGDLLYRLERPPFEAVVSQQEAAVADAAARLANANIQLSRAQSLLNTPAGQRSSVDDAVANQRSQAAQLAGAQAQLRIAQINLAYTEIHAPVSGKISRTNVTTGNVVSPSSGVLATIVSQDPMYVVFPIAVRSQLELEKRYADKGGMNAVLIRIRLPDGSLYNQSGKIDYVEPNVQQNTDTILLRGTIANPPLRPIQPGQLVERTLIDGEFVSVLVEGVEPIEALVIPRAAVLSDQQGDYVYQVDAQNKVEQRRIKLGQSTPSIAVILGGLTEGDMVVLEGLQRVRPGIQVTPGPAAPPPSAPRAAGQ
ncbi:MAG: efflux RND transporter periplasmic adaptor subunit [Acetobacteraceae bacterium]